MSNSVYDKIKDRILTADFETGEIINEKSLAEEFGVSRTPIRESLARLEWEKLVTIIPRAGAMVSPIELNLFKECYQIRYVLDGYLGRLAATRVTAEQIGQLESLAAECDDLINEGGQNALNEVSRRYRGIVAKAANNKTLFEISEMLFNITLRVWHTVAEDEEHADLANAMKKEITDIISAFEKKDPDAAERAMQDAISFYTEKLKRIF